MSRLALISAAVAVGTTTAATNAGTLSVLAGDRSLYTISEGLASSQLSWSELKLTTARLLGVSECGDSGERDLPTGNPFHRAAGALFVAVEGSGGSLLDLPLGSQHLDQSTTFPLAPAALGDDPLFLDASSAESSLDYLLGAHAAEPVAKKLGKLGGDFSGALCLGTSGVCAAAGDEHIVWDASRAAFRPVASSVSELAASDVLSAGFPGLGSESHVDAEGLLHVGDAAFDTSSAAALHFFTELQYLASLPSKFEAAGAAPALLALSSTGLESINSLYGATSTEAAVASELLAKALVHMFDDLAPLYGDQLIGELLVLPSEWTVNVPAGHAASSRRLLSPSTSTSTDCDTTDSVGNCQYNLAEIADFQISLWTAVILIVTALTAACALVNMDVGRDSLLYATFQADVSMKMD